MTKTDRELILAAAAKVDGVKASDVEKLATEFAKGSAERERIRLIENAVTEVSTLLAVIKYRIESGGPMPTLPDDDQRAAVRAVAETAVESVLK